MLREFHGVLRAERLDNPHLSPAYLLAVGNGNWYNYIRLEKDEPILKFDRGRQGKKNYGVHGEVDATKKSNCKLEPMQPRI